MVNSPCCVQPSQICPCDKAWLVAPGLLVPGLLSLGGCTGQEEACTSSDEAIGLMSFALRFFDMGELCTDVPCTSAQGSSQGLDIKMLHSGAYHNPCRAQSAQYR